jgi:hypothetical protein
MFCIKKGNFYLFNYNPYVDLWTEQKAIALKMNKAIALQYVGAVGGEVVSFDR